MYRVEVGVILAGSPPLTEDDLTDLIESVIDELDEHSIEPSVATELVGENVQVEVSLTIDEDQELDALARAISAIRAAFAKAQVGTAGTPLARDVHSRVLPLQAA